MNVLVITCSHRPQQVTYQFAEQFATKLKEKQPVNVEIVELANLNIQSCCATGVCAQNTERTCVHTDDDMIALYEKMSASDALLFVVPKYFPYPSRLIAVLERLGAFGWWCYGERGKSNEFPLVKKPAAMVCYTSVPGTPAELFSPLFLSFASLGFDTIRLTDALGIFFCRADGEEAEILSQLAGAFAERLAAR